MRYSDAQIEHIEGVFKTALEAYRKKIDKESRAHIVDIARGYLVGTDGNNVCHHCLGTGKKH